MLKKQIRKYRKEKNWSQEKLAQQAGVSYTVITKIEQGLTKEPSILTVIKIAKALDITIDELVGRKVKK